MRVVVGLESLKPGYLLYGCGGVANRLVVETATGRKVVVDGKGAGRWPTTVWVVSDVYDAHRRRLTGSGTEKALPAKRPRAIARGLVPGLD